MAWPGPRPLGFLHPARFGSIQIELVLESALDFLQLEPEVSVDSAECVARFQIADFLARSQIALHADSAVWPPALVRLLPGHGRLHPGPVLLVLLRLRRVRNILVVDVPLRRPLARCRNFRAPPPQPPLFWDFGCQTLV